MINKHFKNPLWVLLFSLFIINTVMAQENKSADMVSDFLNVFNFTTGKATQLAGVIPQEKYDWRPAEGVRSIKEVVLHIASANYFFSSMMGGTIPEGIDPRSMEQSDVSREEAVETLKKSVSFVQETVKKLTEDDFNTKIDFFGNKATKRQVMFTLGDHAGEHLGQLIAYARMNGVVPPWSQKSN